jgi:hypothetical protein
MGAGLDMMTSARGASNARARQELGWTLRYPSCGRLPGVLRDRDEAMTWAVS